MKRQRRPAKYSASGKLIKSGKRYDRLPVPEYEKTGTRNPLPYRTSNCCVLLAAVFATAKACHWAQHWIPIGRVADDHLERYREERDYIGEALS